MSCMVIFIGSISASSATFGQGTGLIALNNVQCSGSEARLIDCPSSPVACSHRQDAGVYCRAGGGMCRYQHCMIIALLIYPVCI